MGEGSLVPWSSRRLRSCGSGALGWGFLNISALLLATANLCVVSVVGLHWDSRLPLPVAADLFGMDMGFKA